MSLQNKTGTPLRPTRRYVRAVGPRLRLVLYLVFGLVALLGANSAYLAGITFLEWIEGATYQDYFYQLMFLGHLGLGLLLILPFLCFAVAHLRNAYQRPNRRAVRVGYALLATGVLLLFSGLVLMRIEGFEIKDPHARSAAYWVHVTTPLLCVWLYILHRLAGPRIRWKLALGWLGAVGVAVIAMVWLRAQDPRQWNVAGPEEGAQYFEPSLARTASGNFIPARTLMMDAYCEKCHPDAHAGWAHSAHRFSSFNNPPYLFSISETRRMLMERDGNVKASRWCAGCHDVVPFFSGAFDDPGFDMKHDPTANAGITCTACHAITHINSTRGNGDYTIEEPLHYPFAFSKNRFLRYLNEQLIKAKPAFHKKTFLKPLHRTAEFCSVCHKVSLPYELTHYKEWLRGQNHYDNFLLSGVSGGSAKAFYYPPKAEANCNGCHMPLKASSDFGADYFNGATQLSIHDHLFPSANTGVPFLVGHTNVVKAHQAFLRDTVRIDLFGLKPGGTVDAPLKAPLRPKIPVLEPGKTYLLEVVIRTLKVGHIFTQGTADSNQLWVDAKVASGGKLIGRSGGLNQDNEVDPWAHFLNVYMLDKDGRRIDRRNPQDIFTPLYNHQIPPGAAAVVHYKLAVPEDQRQPIEISVALKYRKFDTTYLKYIYGENAVNRLPISVICRDHLTLPVRQAGTDPEWIAGKRSCPIPEWERWNDYGIGLLLKGNSGSEKGELAQAARAFSRVEALGRAEGPVNLARVYFKEGRLDDAVAALQRAARSQPPAPRWVLAWFNGRVNQQNGFLDQAIKDFRSILEDHYPELDQRGFDFSKDYNVINELGITYFERSKLERGHPRRQSAYLELAKERFEAVLGLDSENLTAHYNLALIDSQMGEPIPAARHRRLHEKYRPDNNARDRAIAIAAGRDPAARHAAQSIVIYDLQRPGAPKGGEP